MKSTTLLLTLLLLPAIAPAQQPVAAQAPAATRNAAGDKPAVPVNASLTQLQALAGTWNGTGPDGSATSTLHTIAGGSALEQTSRTGDGAESVTVFSSDGDRLALVHFAPDGNQPRMATVPLTGKEKKMEFAFTGATNLAAPDDAHRSKLVLTIKDKNHFDEEWTSDDHGKTKTAVTHYTRAS